MKLSGTEAEAKDTKQGIYHRDAENTEFGIG
jgi:hypothetical protein